MTWRRAMHSALYGPGGFYARGEPPARHFRTSVHASPGYGTALAAVLAGVDAALGRPSRLHVVDIGAGRGELLQQVCAAAAPALAARLEAHAVEVAASPAGLDPRIRWGPTLPPGITGVVIASEWLDNVPLDVAELTTAGPRLVEVDCGTGAERLGAPPPPPELAWLAGWWPLRAAGHRAEIGLPRCQAWAGVIGSMARGLAIAADFGHTKAARPPGGTLAGYLAGRAVPPVPDGSRDITAHVALDACAAAGRAAGAQATLLTTQRRALRALGVTGRPPPLALAEHDPVGYALALGRASEDAELIDPAGLGGFGWLAQSVGMPLPEPLATLARRAA